VVGRAGFLLVLLLAASGCAGTLSPHGRGTPQLALEDDERRLWNRAREEEERIARSGLLYRDAAITEYVNTVAQRVLPQAARDAGLKIQVHVIRNQALNAFAMPNGMVYLHTGILARIDNEAQLATLLGHELTHVTHRHLVQEVRGIQNKTAAFAVFQALTVPFGVYGLAAQLLGAVGTMAAITGYSQEMEREADVEGLRAMTAAGYDPREAPKLFVHLKEWVEEEKEPQPFFFNTHPRLRERVESYEELLRREPALATGRERRAGEEEFRARTRLLVMDNALLDLQAGRFLQAQKGMLKFLSMNPEDALSVYYVAESYRRQNEAKERAEAARWYEWAIALDGGYADPYRGLGLLHYQAGARAEAARAFTRYLDLAPAAPDRAYIEQILKELEQ
jgi:predicted Zn-dependent protease